jgi:hypothetical protein
MSGTPTDDATGQVKSKGDVSGEKVEETQDQKEVSGMPSRQEEVLALLTTIFLFVFFSIYKHLFQVLVQSDLWAYL